MRATIGQATATSTAMPLGTRKSQTIGTVTVTSAAVVAARLQDQAVVGYSQEAHWVAVTLVRETLEFVVSYLVVSTSSITDLRIQLFLALALAILIGYPLRRVSSGLH